MRLKSSPSKGFTIAELLIATSVFGVIMLIAMTGILYIGKIYYKGIITSKTQETTRSITQEISNTFQFGGLTPVTDPRAPDPPVGFVVKAQCIGNSRYTYFVVPSVADGDPPTPTPKHALWHDIKKESALCTPLDLDEVDPSEGDPTTDDSPQSIPQRRELLPPNMRLHEFSMVQPPGRSFMTLKIKVIYGEQDLSPTGKCVSTQIGGQFCAVSALNTTVKKRL